MPNLRSAAGASYIIDGDDIESRHKVNELAQMNVPAGDLPDLCPFATINGIFRRSESMTATRFYLDKDQGISIAHDEVDLAISTEVKITFDKDQSLLFEEDERKLFVIFTECATIERGTGFHVLRSPFVRIRPPYHKVMSRQMVITLSILLFGCRWCAATKELVIEIGVPTLQRYRTTTDKEARKLRRRLERVAIGNEQRCLLAHLDRTATSVDPEYLACFKDWVTYLKSEKLFGPDDPLFPPAKIRGGRGNSDRLLRWIA